MTDATALRPVHFHPVTACYRHGNRRCDRYVTACYRPVYLPPYNPPAVAARFGPGGPAWLARRRAREKAEGDFTRELYPRSRCLTVSAHARLTGLMTKGWNDLLITACALISEIPSGARNTLICATCFQAFKINLGLPMCFPASRNAVARWPNLLVSLRREGNDQQSLGQMARAFTRDRASSFTLLAVIARAARALTKCGNRRAIPDVLPVNDRGWHAGWGRKPARPSIRSHSPLSRSSFPKLAAASWLKIHRGWNAAQRLSGLAGFISPAGRSPCAADGNAPVRASGGLQ